MFHSIGFCFQGLEETTLQSCGRQTLLLWGTCLNYPSILYVCPTGILGFYLLNDPLKWAYFQGGLRYRRGGVGLVFGLKFVGGYKNTTWKLSKRIEKQVLQSFSKQTLQVSEDALYVKCKTSSTLWTLVLKSPYPGWLIIWVAYYWGGEKGGANFRNFVLYFFSARYSLFVGHC